MNFHYINQVFKKNDLQSIIGDNYKLIIIRKDFFNDVFSIPIAEDQSITRIELFELLSSKTPIDDYITLSLGGDTAKIQKESYKENLIQSLQISTDEEFKDILFFTAFATAAENKGPLFLLNAFKKETVIIYPQTLFFDTLKVIPKIK